MDRDPVELFLLLSFGRKVLSVTPVYTAAVRNVFP